MIGTKFLSRSFAPFFMAVLASFAILPIIGTARAASQVASPCKPNAEQWVLEKVAAGVEADLGLCTVSDRVLRADFLVNLLTGSLEDSEVQYKGVRIANGVVAERLDLELAEISHDTRLTGFRFEGNVDLSMSVFQKGVSFAGSQFGTANFTEMKVGGRADFNSAVFSGPVNFNRAAIGGSFFAVGAVFNNPKETTWFSSMEVGGHAFFDDSEFAGQVNFIAADISGQFQARRALFNSTLNMNSIKVGAAALFNNAVFDGKVSLRVSEIQIVNVTGVSWPGGEDSIQLDGITYKIISAGDDILVAPGGVTRHVQESWKDLLNLADRAIYSRSVYAGLEEYYRSQGEDGIADKFFVAQKRRQRKEALGGPKEPAWWGSISLDYLVLFGLSPHRAFGIGALFLLLGTGVYFGRANMQPRNPNTSAGRHERPSALPWTNRVGSTSPRAEGTGSRSTEGTSLYHRNLRGV